MHDQFQPWDNEPLQATMERWAWNVTSPGPLYNPINNISLYRDDKLQLKLESDTIFPAATNRVRHPSGTVRIINEQVIIETEGGNIEIILNGIQPLNYHPILLEANNSGQSYKEISSVTDIKCTVKNILCAAYTIDWIANKFENIIFSDLITDETEIIDRRTFGSVDAPKEFIFKRKFSSKSLNIVSFTVDDVDIYLGKGDIETKKSSFIFYSSLVSDEFKEKIRLCLSFCMGQYITHLGNSIISDDFQLKSFTCRSGFIFRNQNLNHVQNLLAPLGGAQSGTPFIRHIETENFSRMMNAFYNNVETLKLRHVGILYWHAMYAPFDIAAIHFGSAIEALQNAYITSRELTIDNIINEDLFEEIKRGIKNKLAEFELEQEVVKEINEKLHFLNNAPHKLTSKRLVKHLNLEFHDKEWKAWKRRNNVGHGADSGREDLVELIRDLKLLRIRFNRLLLAMTNASEMYIENYNIHDGLSIDQGGYIKNLREPIIAE
jgi:hypothetical protein